MDFVAVNLISWNEKELFFTWRDEPCSYSSLVRQCQSFNKLLPPLLAYSNIFITRSKKYVNGDKVQAFIYDESVCVRWLKALFHLSSCKPKPPVLKMLIRLSIRHGRTNIADWCRRTSPDVFKDLLLRIFTKRLGPKTLTNLFNFKICEMKNQPCIVSHWKWLYESAGLSANDIWSFITRDDKSATSADDDAIKYDRDFKTMVNIPDLNELTQRFPKESRGPSIRSAWNSITHTVVRDAFERFESKDLSPVTTRQQILSLHLTMELMGWKDTKPDVVGSEQAFLWISWIRSVFPDTNGFLFQPWQLVFFLLHSKTPAHRIEWMNWLKPYVALLPEIVVLKIGEELSRLMEDIDDGISFPSWLRIILPHRHQYQVKDQSAYFDIDWKSSEWSSLREKYFVDAQEHAEMFRLVPKGRWDPGNITEFCHCVKNGIIPVEEITDEEWIHLAICSQESDSEIDFHGLSKAIQPKTIMGMVTGLSMRYFDQLISDLITFLPVLPANSTLQFLETLQQRGDTRWIESKSWVQSVEEWSTLIAELQGQPAEVISRYGRHLQAVIQFAIQKEIWSPDYCISLVCRLLEKLSWPNVLVALKMAKVVHYAMPLRTTTCPQWMIPQDVPPEYPPNRWKDDLQAAGLLVKK